LIVDDDRDIREILADLLVDKGYDVSVATNGQEAFEMCRAQRAPDLIFLDLQMPVMDGLEFTRLKDADPQLSQVPVCVMTAFAGSVAIPPTSSVVLRKPLGSADLFSVAKRFCPLPTG
jgi:CheY-like chemotaxis protein